MSQSDADLLERLNNVIIKAQTAGANAADLLYAEGTSVTMSYRLGKPENLDRAEGIDLGLRVLVGKRQAIVSSSDCSDAALDELVERAVAMARVVPEDQLLITEMYFRLEVDSVLHYRVVFSSMDFIGSLG